MTEFMLIYFILEAIDIDKIIQGRDFLSVDKYISEVNLI